MGFEKKTSRARAIENDLLAHGRALAYALLLCPLLAHGVQDELQIYTDDLNETGEFSVEVQGLFVPTGRPRLSDERLAPSSHLLRLSPEISYGLTSNLQAGMQFFGSVDGSGRTKVDGGRLELTYIGRKPDKDGYFWGVLVEAGKLPKTLSTASLNAEIKGIFGYRGDRWLFVANPTLDKKIKGEGNDEPAEVGLNLKAAYRVAPTLNFGIEHYAELGSVKRIEHLSEQSQQTFLVADLRWRKWEFNGGIGHGWNDASDKWTFKLIIGIPFDD